jgi:hypothetical protein
MVFMISAEFRAPEREVAELVLWAERDVLKKPEMSGNI